MLRELDHRSAEGGRLSVSLDWDPEDGQTVLTVADHDGTRQAVVPPAEARQAFLHPYVYLAS